MRTILKGIIYVLAAVVALGMVIWRQAEYIREDIHKYLYRRRK